ncbi:30S ribosomal protein S12 methylthiotransferase RimO [bacterium]|nr:30S ribosomal protein S12 methylthiotransferase RimO [bacterium]
MLKVAVVNLGCPKNEVDAEKLVHLLIEAGFELLAEVDQAEVIIVNTCAFIQPAVEEAIETILSLAEYKKSAYCQALVVGGCLPQRYGSGILKEIPEIDLLFGADGFAQIPAAIKNFVGKQPQKFNLVHQLCDLDYSEINPLLQTISPPQAFSYLKIAEGCDNRCSYCMIPMIKGKQQSIPIETLISQAQKMVSGGVREINVIAQDITAYGRDLKEQPTLCNLLTELLQISNLGRLRLLYAYPYRISNDLIELIAAENQLCNYLDIPIQHISDPILKLMGRRDTSKDIRLTLEALKTKVPGIFLRSTVMVGFPGESETDFARLLGFVEEGFFDYLGAFSYWPEDGSTAAKFPHQVPDTIKDERLQAVLDAQRQVTEKRLRAKIGSRERVLIEGLSLESDLLLQGRCDFQAPEIDGLTYITEVDSDIAPGTLVDADIYDAHEFDLFAKVIR